MFASMGTRVSPIPRSAPVITTCAASNTANSAASASSTTPTAVTPGSCVYSAISVRGANTNALAEHSMKLTAKPNESQPARRAFAGSPAPMA